MERKIRKPTQKRALEKFNKITEAAFKLFNEKGYFNTTTADIAKEADVATGSVYAYFEDKRDIYIQVLKQIYDSFIYPTEGFWLRGDTIDLKDPSVCKTLFSEFIELMLKHHNFTKTFHDEQVALTLLDPEIGDFVRELEDRRMDKIQNIFVHLKIPFKSEEDSKILMHFSNMLVEDICHKILYDTTVKDMKLYIERCVDMFYTLFQATTIFNSL